MCRIDEYINITIIYISLFLFLGSVTVFLNSENFIVLFLTTNLGKKIKEQPKFLYFTLNKFSLYVIFYNLKMFNRLNVYTYLSNAYNMFIHLVETLNS